MTKEETVPLRDYQALSKVHEAANRRIDELERNLAAMRIVNQKLTAEKVLWVNEDQKRQLIIQQQLGVEQNTIRRLQDEIMDVRTKWKECKLDKKQLLLKLKVYEEGNGNIS